MPLETNNEPIPEKLISVPFSSLNKEQKDHLLKWLLGEKVPAEAKTVLAIAQAVREEVPINDREIVFKAAIQCTFRQSIHW